MKKVFIFILALVLATVFFLLFKFQDFYGAIYTPKKNAPSLAPEKTAFNILFMGYGGANHDGAYLTDTLMLIHIDITKNKVLLVSLPRDIWVNVPTKSRDSFHAKINTLYQMELFPKTFPDVDTRKANTSSTSIIANTVSEITGLPVDYFVGANFAGFTKAIDRIGGIDVTVQKSFTDSEYPIDGQEDNLCGKEEQFKAIEPFFNEDETATPEAREKLFKEKPELGELLKNATESPEIAFPCRYETLSYAAGKQHMNGTQALKYARSRHSPQDGGDFARARRQQQVIEALKNKALTIASLPKVLGLMDELKNDIKTDVPPELIKKFVVEAKDADSYKISNLVLSDNDYLDYGRSGDGQSILIPKAGEDNWSEVKKWIKDTINPPKVTK